MNLHKKEKDLLLESSNIQHEQIKKFFAEHPFQPLDALPYDARLYERKTMNDSVPRKWLTYNKETKRLYCSYCLAFECPNTCNRHPLYLALVTTGVLARACLYTNRQQNMSEMLSNISVWLMMAP